MKRNGQVGKAQRYVRDKCARNAEANEREEAYLDNEIPSAF
jgi:hypothetical protein